MCQEDSAHDFKKLKWQGPTNIPSLLALQRNWNQKNPLQMTHSLVQFSPVVLSAQPANYSKLKNKIYNTTIRAYGGSILGI